MDRIEYEILVDYNNYSVVCWWYFSKKDTLLSNPHRTNLGKIQNFKTLKEARKYCNENASEGQGYIAVKDFRYLPVKVTKYALHYQVKVQE